MSAEANFRKGVLEGARWLSGEAHRLSAEGYSGDEIADRLYDLNEVLQDWYSGLAGMPEGLPWEWEPDDLQRFITDRLDSTRPEVSIQEEGALTEKWTRALPLAEGFYWYREERLGTPEKVEVFYLRGRLHVVLPAHAEPVPISVVTGEWCGPISLPD